MVKHPRRVDQSNSQLAWTFALRLIVELEGEFPRETLGASKPAGAPDMASEPPEVSRPLAGVTPG
jgi:hypothetical protein